MAIRVRRVLENEQAMGEFRSIAAATTSDWSRRLSHHTSGVAAAMAEIHGGRWNVTIDHECFLVLISQQVD